MAVTSAVARGAIFASAVFSSPGLTVGPLGSRKGLAGLSRDLERPSLVLVRVMGTTLSTGLCSSEGWILPLLPPGGESPCPAVSPSVARLNSTHSKGGGSVPVVEEAATTSSSTSAS